MDIRFDNKDGSPAYLLKKQDPGYELFRYESPKAITRGVHAGKMSSEGYKKMAGGNGLFPSTVSHAVELIAADYMTLKDCTIDISAIRKEVSVYLRDLKAVSEGMLESL